MDAGFGTAHVDYQNLNSAYSFAYFDMKKSCRYAAAALHIPSVSRSLKHINRQHKPNLCSRERSL